MQIFLIVQNTEQNISRGQTILFIKNNFHEILDILFDGIYKYILHGLKKYLQTPLGIKLKTFTRKILIIYLGEIFVNYQIKVIAILRLVTRRVIWYENKA